MNNVSEIFGHLATSIGNSVSGIANWVFTSFYNLGSFLYTNVPMFFYNAFMTAVDFVMYSLFQMPTDIANLFWDMGTNMVTSLQEVVSSMWGSFVEWIYNKIASIPGLSSIMESTTGLDINAESAQSAIKNVKPNTTQPSKIGDRIAEGKSKTQSYGNMQMALPPELAKALANGQNSNINLYIDGERVTNVVNKRNVKNNARKS